MQIGIHQYDTADRDLVADLGAQWTKYSTSVETTDFDSIDRTVDAALADGLRVVIDLRTNKQALYDAVMAWRGGHQADAVPVHQQYVADSAAHVVEHLADRVQDWEFWGEFPCPYVSGMGPLGLADAYPFWLAPVYDAVHNAQPEARVWNGGYGTDAETEFLRGIISDGSGDKLDCVNLHHYLMRDLWPETGPDEFDTTLSVDRQIDWTVGRYETMFADVRALLGDRQLPIVSSEWGCPIARYGAGARACGMTSYVFQGQIHAPFDTRSAELYGEWLACFARNGMQVLVVHSLRDEGADKRIEGGLHWGRFCGLHYKDGEAKRSYDVVRDWAWRGHSAPVDWGPAWS